MQDMPINDHAPAVENLSGTAETPLRLVKPTKKRKRRRGRPPTFLAAQRRKLARLVRLHGARGALAASSVPVSMGTVLKIAREYGIQLKKGKRPRKAA